MPLSATVYVVDDDEAMRDSLNALLESEGLAVATFGAAGGFLENYDAGRAGCLLADIRMPDMDGLTLQEHLARAGSTLPVIIITGHGDVPLAVRAMKAGAVDFLEKPFEDVVLLASVKRALEVGEQTRSAESRLREAQELLTSLTPRERDVLELLIQGEPNKIIAYRLGISPRTVEIHRANVMRKLEARSLSDVVRTALEGGILPASD